MRDSIIFYRTFLEAIAELSDQDRLLAYDSIFNYALNDIEPDIKGAAACAFKLAKPNIDTNNKKYENGKLGSIYGSKGGRPTANPKQTPSKPQDNPKQTPSKPQDVKIETPELKNVNPKTEKHKPLMNNELCLMNNESCLMNNEKEEESLSQFKNQDFEDIKNAWNAFAIKNNLNKIDIINDSRKKAIKQRAKEKEFNLEKIFEEIEKSDFLIGLTKDFQVTFDWIFVGQKNYLKIIEGNYRNKQSGNLQDDMKRKYAWFLDDKKEPLKNVQFG